MRFEELIRVGTMILSGGQTGKNISISQLIAYAHFVQVESIQINKELFLDSQEYLAVQE